MQVTKPRTEFFAILRGIKGLGNLSGFKVSYAVMRIKAVLESEAKRAKEIGWPSKEYNDFDIKRDALAKSFARKDALGKPLTIQNGPNLEYDMTEEDKANFDKAFAELSAENAELVREREEQKKRLDAFLLEETTLSFHDIKKEHLPENITVQQLEILAPFIVDLEQ